MLGVMSGTSLDGIDLVGVNFVCGETWEFSIEAAQTIGYTDVWRDRLTNLHQASETQIRAENEVYTKFLAKTILEFIEAHNLREIEAVCSHGHTLFHQPEKGYTFQLGNIKKLAEFLGYPVVCDFRIQDVALGGQGAPLVPIGDQLLFSEYDACLNLGGFANVSKTIEGQLIAYDLAAVNTVLNTLSQKKGKPYDKGGQWAKKGSLISPFFKALETLDFYNKEAPKSLGIEWVDSEIFPLLDKYKTEEIDDLLHTYAVHIGKQIGASFRSNIKVLATGGGVKNDFLMQQIKTHSAAEIIIPTEEIVDFKEALIFALLGVLRLRDEINCLSSVTGSSKDHSTGIIYFP